MATDYPDESHIPAMSIYQHGFILCLIITVTVNLTIPLHKHLGGKKRKKKPKDTHTQKTNHHTTLENSLATMS